MSRSSSAPRPERLTVSVVGGTGFLGARIVRAFTASGHHARAVARHPEGSEGSVPDVEPVRADIHDRDAVRAAVAGADVVVNAVSLYIETGGATFHSVHVAGAETVAEAAREAGARALVHISGIGADNQSSDAFIRSRGEGEDVVRRVFPEAAILRPSVMFAAEAGFLVVLAGLVRTLPVLPLFGRGDTRLQPVHADNVAQAVSCVAANSEFHGQIHYAAGPAIYTYGELVELVARETGARTLPVPFPFAFWDLAAPIAERLPGAPLSRAQVALMREDNTADNSPVFAACGIRRRRVETVLKQIAGRRRA